ncbi:uncharacterized protein LOC117291613 [Asterias rubens]|uniref:uncharacterized protein LOC117291613 n=1 Tax=Asterias rubens TaxID=7604 RepID=UPI001454FEDA|nr:uncharacterized protein LOC117291613 [Asterias rubens]
MDEASGRRGAVYIHASDTQNTLESGNTSGNEPSNAQGFSHYLDGGIIEEDTEEETTADTANTTPTTASSSKRHTPSVERQTRSATPVKQDEDKMAGNKRTRRGSINLQVRRPNTLPEFPSAPQQRRMSVRRNSTLPMHGVSTPAATRRTSVTPKVKEPEPALTAEQKAAFKEAFDLFDSNGGGSIDAEELAEALNSVDIHLSVDEIKEVLQAIDKDGSGEIDFEEFLNMMTNTEKFLEMFASKHEGEGPRELAGRGHILFDALTQFMKSSALKQMDEIVGYYKNKYRRVNAPHVVMHYAAGARLIGLTEKQLARHLERLQASNQGNDLKSPYAQPLHIFLTGPPVKNVKKKEPPIEQRRRRTGKIRLFVHLPPSSDSDETEKYTKSQREVTHSCKNTDITSILKPASKPRLGWIKPRIKSIAARLPQRKSVLTMEDLASIRKRISDAKQEYYHDLAKNKVEENQRYWRSLQPQYIPSETLRTNFQKVFCAYIAAGQRKM